MTKTTKVTYQGDGSDAQSVDFHGHTFIKGHPTEVPHDHKAALEAMEAHPHFQVAGGEKVDAPEDTDEEQETFHLRHLLDSQGIRYRSNASLSALRKLAADASVSPKATTVDGPHPTLAAHGPKAVEDTVSLDPGHPVTAEPGTDPAKRPKGTKDN